MTLKRIFRLAYHTSQSQDLKFPIFQLRDGDAFAQVSAILYSRGYEYGGLLLNLPFDESKKAPPVDVSFLTRLDLLILNTRPPLDDITEEDKKRVLESHTSLEKSVFVALKSYFEKCARSRVKLDRTVARQLPDAFRNRADITFREYTDGSYLKYRGHGDRFWQKPDDPNSTAFYLVQIPEIWEDGPGLLATFGMCGTETLVWNYLLRTRFPEWVGKYQFLMAEVGSSRVPHQPHNLSFADNREVKAILQIPLHKLGAAHGSSVTNKNRTN